MSNENENEAGLVQPEALSRAVKEAITAVEAAATLEELAAARIACLGDKAPVSLARRAIGSLPGKERGEAGRNVNAARGEITAAYEDRKAVLEAAEAERILREETVDVTARTPGADPARATRSASRWTASPTCSSRWATRSARAPRSSWSGSTSTRSTSTPTTRPGP
ncbi:hypothetical protein GCM10029992_56360 [Glycomyces albus]